MARKKKLKGGDLLSRLHAVKGDRSIAQFADFLGVHRETCRRYLIGTSVPASFIATLCEREGVNANWLLLGIEPAHGTDQLTMFREAVNTDRLTIEVSKGVARACGFRPARQGASSR